MRFCDFVETNPRVILPPEGSVPFVSMEQVTPGNRWVRSSSRRIVRGSGSKFNPGDTLFARITPSLENGKIAQYAGEAPAMGSTEFIVLRAREGVADPGFVYYFSQTRDFRRTAERSMSGASGRQRVSVSALNEYECSFPLLESQREIAAILSAYDELIENTIQRIRVTEAMVHEIFGEWFVDHRFPGHEESDSQKLRRGGVLPNGWSMKPMSDCVTVNPKVRVAQSGVRPFVTMGNLSNELMIINGIGTREGNSGSKFQNGDTLLARITPCLENGKTGFVQFLPDQSSVATGSTEFIVLRSKTLSPEYVYCLARSDKLRSLAIKSMSGASGRQRVREQCFEELSILQPPRSILDRFTEVAAPSFNLIEQLNMQVRNLRDARELLIPRLLFGESEIRAN